MNIDEAKAAERDRGRKARAEGLRLLGELVRTLADAGDQDLFQRAAKLHDATARKWQKDGVIRGDLEAQLRRQVAKRPPRTDAAFAAQLAREFPLPEDAGTRAAMSTPEKWEAWLLHRLGELRRAKEEGGKR